MIKTAIYALVLLFIGSISWYVYAGSNESINFILAGISSLFIIYASFYGYFKMINSKTDETQTEQNEQLHQQNDDDEDEEDEKIPVKNALINSYKGWLFPLRLVSYVVLVLSFLALSNKQMLFIAPFLSGLAIMPIAAMIYMYKAKKENETSNN